MRSVKFLRVCARLVWDVGVLVQVSGLGFWWLGLWFRFRVQGFGACWGLGL